MRKFNILVLLLLVLSSHYSYAQGWNWGRAGKITTTGLEEGGPVAVDNEGNVYGINAIGSLLFGPGVITSTYGPLSVTDSLDFSQSAVYSLDSSGNYRWAIGAYGAKVDLNNIFTDDAGNVYLSGFKNAPTGYFAGFLITGPAIQNFIVKLNSSGRGIWLKTLPAGIDLLNINVSHSGEVYFTGDFTTVPVTIGATTITGHNGTDVIFGKYDSSGNPLWAMSFGGDSTDYGTFISLTDNGVAYLSGTSVSSAIVIGHDTLVNPTGKGNTFFFVSKIDTGRNAAWGRSIVPSHNGGSIGGIAVGNTDNLYCAGTYVTSIASGSVALPPISPGRSAMFLFRFDSSGHLKWGKTITDTLFTSAAAVGADGCGNIWVSGQGGRSYTPGKDPMFLARFDSSGTLEDTVFLSSGGDDANWMVLDKKGNLYVTGDYETTPFALGDDTLNAIVNESLFIGKYIYGLPNCVRDTIPYHHTKTMIENVPGKTGTIFIYPNPASALFTIYSDVPFTPGAKAELYDMAGRLLYSGSLYSQSTQISVAGLPAGVYQCRIYSPGATQVTRKVVVIK
jgi:hypothetical protein